MARTLIPVIALVANASIPAPAPVAIDQANGMNAKFASNLVPASAGLEHAVLIVSNTAAAAKNIIVRAGVGGGITPGPAFRSGLGDLVIPIPAGATRWLGPFDSARHMQLDGSVNLDFEAGFTGNITAVLVPPRV
jgi:hypothetical protein